MQRQVPGRARVGVDTARAVLVRLARDGVGDVQNRSQPRGTQTARRWRLRAGEGIRWRRWSMRVEVSRVADAEAGDAMIEVGERYQEQEAAVADFFSLTAAGTGGAAGAP